jgi:type VI secretion system protein ImpM
MLAASRTELGDAWLPAWLEAPIWRFALPPGLCGPDAVLGLWLPSVDRVGRYFPLTLAAVAAEADAGGLICRGGGFLAAGEQAGCDAVTQELSPDELNARLVAAAAALPADPGVDPGLCKPFGSLWWTAGAPRVQAAAFSTDGLPDSATFTRMLDDRVCAAIVARCEADP